MQRRDPVFHLTVLFAATMALSACSSAGSSGAFAKTVANNPKYAAYVTPSGKHVVPARPLKPVPVPPVYPPEAALSGTQGKFHICFKVSKSGQVENPHILKQQGNTKGKSFSQLRKEAMYLITQWDYAPETIDGKRVPGKDCQDITFGLSH